MNRQTDGRSSKIQKQLLMGASALALVTVIYGADADAAANDADRPTVWIEAGWHFERYMGQGDPFAPPFVVNTDWSSVGLTSPIAAEKLSPFSYGADGKISFQPEDSDWIFSASVRYGRAHGLKRTHQQIKDKGQYFDFKPLGYGTKYLHDFLADTAASSRESHAIIDFQAGKDVGLGRLGTSTISAGVRFAQMSSSVGATIHGRADQHFQYLSFFGFHIPFEVFHAYNATASDTHHFNGIGPSLSWSASTPLVGNPNDGEIALDWGVNGAVLFGKQRTKSDGHVTKNGFSIKYGFGQSAYRMLTRYPVSHSREKSVAVPNLGGFAGFSYRFVDAKLSLGYRADFFFGAIDGGWDAKHEITRSFNGPYASISVGLGD